MTFDEFAKLSPEERVRFQNTTALMNIGCGILIGIMFSALIVVILLLTNVLGV